MILLLINKVRSHHRIDGILNEINICKQGLASASSSSSSSSYFYDCLHPFAMCRKFCVEKDLAQMEKCHDGLSMFGLE